MVHICSRRQALLDQTSFDISTKTGRQVHAHACGIRDVDAMAEAIWAIGPLTGLFNSAAANFDHSDQR